MGLRVVKKSTTTKGLKELKVNNNTVTRVITALIIAAVLGIFGFATNLDKRIDRLDVEFAKMGKDIEYIKESAEKLLNDQ